MKKSTSLFAGLDLGGSMDYHALAIVEGTGTEHTVKVPYMRPAYPRPCKATRLETYEALPATYAVSWLQRWPLGTRFSDVVEDVKERTKGCFLVMDASGGGGNAWAMSEQKGLRSLPMIITSGEQGRVTDDAAFIPRNDLLMRLRTAMDNGDLAIAQSLELAPELGKELRGIQERRGRSGRLTLQHEDAAHDDLVLSVAMAVWLAEFWFGRPQQFGRMVSAEEASAGLAPPGIRPPW